MPKLPNPHFLSKSTQVLLDKFPNDPTFPCTLCYKIFTMCCTFYISARANCEELAQRNVEEMEEVEKRDLAECRETMEKRDGFSGKTFFCA